MKTNQEIQEEARQLMALTNNFLSEQRTSGSAASHPDERMRFQLATSVTPAGKDRFVEAAMVGGAPIFRLMERETDAMGSDRDESTTQATLLASSASAFDVLSTGYEIAEEEKLGVKLERFAERSEDSLDPADRETVAEVEDILESKLLTPAERLRTKAEVVEFLEGRLEPSVLIARNIERQCSRENNREHLVERHDLKLTVGEP